VEQPLKSILALWKSRDHIKKFKWTNYLNYITYITNLSWVFTALYFSPCCFFLMKLAIK